VNIFSVWFVVGFAIGAIAGTLATDLTREQLFENDQFSRTVSFWRWPYQQSLLFLALLWGLLVLAAVITGHLQGTIETWRNALTGSIIGAAAAPWIWLHFSRQFGTRGSLEPGGREALIIARAHRIWLEQGQPTGRADEHYAAAQKELESAEQLATETSAKSAEQQLSRYQLASVLLGIALLATMLLPVLQDWIHRTQQIQAFGLSLTLITQRTQNRGTPVVPYAPSTGAEQQGGDLLLDATTEAYQVGAANIKEPIAILDLIGLDLGRFGNLSMIDRDSVFIAWLTYELPQSGKMRLRDGARPRPEFVQPNLAKYVEHAEDLLRAYQPSKWIDPNLDKAFATSSTIISACLHEYAARVHDPHFLMIDVGRFLRNISLEVRENSSSAQERENSLSAISEMQLNFPGYLQSSADLGNLGPHCDPGALKSQEVAINIAARPNQRFNVTPYPSLIASDYLAAIGDRGGWPNSDRSISGISA
jgi:hypothetical protein